MSAPDADDRAVWLLDVDGVLNAAAMGPGSQQWPHWRTGYAMADGSSWPITWAPPVVEAITRVHDSGRAEIVWLTTWLEDANTSLGHLLGLPRFPVLPYPDGDATHGPQGFPGVRAGTPTPWWKLRAARRLLDPQPRRPLVWTDDDLAHEDGARNWARQRLGPALLVAPATDVGLTADDLHAIEEFCVHPRR